MSFTTQGLDTKDKAFGPSKYITYGIQDLKINKMEIKTASTGSKQVVFHVEGRPVKEDNFEGVDGAAGPVGRITTIYMKPDKENEVAMLFGKIADAMEVREKLDAVTANTLEQYVEAVSKIITGKFAAFVVGTEQYWDEKAGKAKNSFRFPRYDFVEKPGTNPSKLKFDVKNTYHFKPAVIPANIGTPSSATAVPGAGDDDLPF